MKTRTVAEVICAFDAAAELTHALWDDEAEPAARDVARKSLIDAIKVLDAARLPPRDLDTFKSFYAVNHAIAGGKGRFTHVPRVLNYITPYVGSVWPIWRAWLVAARRAQGCGKYREAALLIEKQLVEYVTESESGAGTSFIKDAPPDYRRLLRQSRARKLLTWLKSIA